MSQSLSDSRLTNLSAMEIRRGFDEYHDAFKMITRRAKSRFEQCDWHGMLADSTERLALRNKVLALTVRAIRELLGGPGFGSFRLGGHQSRLFRTDRGT